MANEANIADQMRTMPDGGAAFINCGTKSDASNGIDREAVARTIASAMGDNFSDAFKNKERWIAKRGMSGGRFRDVNEPFQADYLYAADAVIALLKLETPHA